MSWSPKKGMRDLSDTPTDLQHFLELWLNNLEYEQANTLKRCI